MNVQPIPAKYALVHEELFKKLEEPGVEGVVDNAEIKKVKVLDIGQVVHDCPTKVRDFVLSESNSGAWRR
ncbi:hypothetical protein TrRE_jg10349 [Triparma retinervis]|uniref:Uncharacterized protein n=1 Tax=Triparma retinervis TaxID=2557542 RepID=A0A9W7FWL6_9STRA|nr:hypothetical protein TrRE_jg10349 [Triparma retinervis]